MEFLGCLSYGDTGSGKTHFYATWPKPVFICWKAERGYDTLKGLGPKIWYDPNIAPVVKIVATTQELLGALREYIVPGVKKGIYETVVFDCGSTYFGSYLGRLQIEAAKAVKANKYALWESYNNHALLLREEVNALDCNVAWNFQAKITESEEGDKVGEIFATGAVKTIIPAGSSNHFYHRRLGNKWEMFLQPCGVFNAKVRITNPELTQDKLPRSIIDPTYKTLLKTLGY